MNKIVLAFPSADVMAAFVLDCKIMKVEIDSEKLTLTGTIPAECLQLAFEQYGASIPKAPDFILGDGDEKVSA